MRGTFRLVLAALLALACRPAPPVKMDARRVFQSVAGIMDTSRFNMISSIYASPDGTVWIVWVDWGFWRTARASAWHTQRFSGVGDPLGKDVILSSSQLLGSITGAYPVGTTPDGSLVLDLDQSHPNDMSRLAKIGPSGATEVTDVLPGHFMGQPFVDRDGIADVLVVSGSPSNYMQVDMKARGLPVMRSLSYDRPFNGLASVPEYLRWGAGRRGMPGEIAFLSEQQGRLLVATPRHDSSGLLYGVYRIRTRTLALIDSGSINLTRDVYRTWSGPVIRRSVIVPAHDAGYWIFTPTSDTPPSPTVVAFRLGPNLKVIRPSSVSAGVAEPFVAVPRGAAVSAWSKFAFKERWENGAWVVPAKLKLSFIAFDGDGRLYTQTFEDSITSRVTK